jgi:hypothetical protein
MQRLGLPSLASEDAFVPGRDIVSSLFLRSFSVACLYGRRDVGFSSRFWCLEASSGSHGGGLLLKDREEVSSSLTSVRQFAKRAKKWHGDPYAWLPVPPEGEQVPPSQPNAGSVKNRNHQKRMAQRAEFGKVRNTASAVSKHFVGSAFQGRDIVMHPPETGQSLVSLYSRVMWSLLQKHF